MPKGLSHFFPFADQGPLLAPATTFHHPTYIHNGYINSGKWASGEKRTINDLIKEVIKRDGCYVDYPDECGDPTCWGTKHAMARRQDYRDFIARLSRNEATAIYKRLYWLRSGFDKVSEIPFKLTEELFDTSVNSGSGTTAGFLLRALNALNWNSRYYGHMIVGRRISPATLLALTALSCNRCDGSEAVFTKAFDALQGARCHQQAETIPSQETCLYG